MIHSVLSNYKEASKDWGRAIQITFDEIKLAPAKNNCAYENYFQRAVIYTAADEFGRALAEYSKSIELKKDNSQTYFYRADLYSRQKKYKSAIDDLTKAISLDPQFAENYKDRADAFEKIGEAEKGKVDREKYEELSKKNWRLKNK